MTLQSSPDPFLCRECATSEDTCQASPQPCCLVCSEMNVSPHVSRAPGHPGALEEPHEHRYMPDPDKGTVAKNATCERCGRSRDEAPPAPTTAAC